MAEDARAPEGPRARVDAVRRAVDGALQAATGSATGPRERAQDLADEVTRAAARLRGALDEMRPASPADELQHAGARLLRAVDELRPAGGDEVRRLRERVEELEARLARLEDAADRPARDGGPADG